MGLGLWRHESLSGVPGAGPDLAAARNNEPTDYLLEHKGRKVAVLEAKAEDKPRTEGLGQAKDYATKLGVRFAYCRTVSATTPSIRQQVKRARSTRYRALKSFGASRSVPNQSWPRSFRRFRLKPMGDGSSLAITKSGRLLRCMMRSLPARSACC